MDNIPISWLGDQGWKAIVVWVVWAVVTGRLVPSRTSDLWRDAYLEQRQQQVALLEAWRRSLLSQPEQPVPSEEPPEEEHP